MKHPITELQLKKEFLNILFFAKLMNGLTLENRLPFYELVS